MLFSGGTIMYVYTEKGSIQDRYNLFRYPVE